MRRGTIRAALPAVAVAAALVLTGCNEEETASAGQGDGSEQGQGGEQGGDSAQEGDGAAEEGGEGEEAQSHGPKPEDLSAIDPESLPQGVTPEDVENAVPSGVADLIPWEWLEDLLPGAEEEVETRPATIAELQGSWWTGPEDSDSYLSFDERGEVMFIEDFEVEGDICYGATTEGEQNTTFELPYCSMYGDVEWPSRTATLEMQEGTDQTTLVVTWEDGTVHEYATDGYREDSTA